MYVKYLLRNKKRKIYDELKQYSSKDFSSFFKYIETAFCCDQEKLELWSCSFSRTSNSNMSSEAIALGQLALDSSCSPHTCGGLESPLAESSPNASVHFADHPHHQARVLLRQEVPVYQIDDGAHGGTCMRKVLITLIIILSILILLVIILRSIF